MTNLTHRQKEVVSYVLGCVLDGVYFNGVCYETNDGDIEVMLSKRELQILKRAMINLLHPKPGEQRAPLSFLETVLAVVRENLTLNDSGKYEDNGLINIFLTPSNHKILSYLHSQLTRIPSIGKQLRKRNLTNIQGNINSLKILSRTIPPGMTPDWWWSILAPLYDTTTKTVKSISLSDGRQLPLMEPVVKDGVKYFSLEQVAWLKDQSTSDVICLAKHNKWHCEPIPFLDRYLFCYKIEDLTASVKASYTLYKNNRKNTEVK